MSENIAIVIVTFLFDKLTSWIRTKISHRKGAVLTIRRKSKKPKSYLQITFWKTTNDISELADFDGIYQVFVPQSGIEPELHG